MLISVLFLLLAAMPLAPAGAVANDSAETRSSRNADINAIRATLHNGNPDIAKSKAFMLLKTGHVDDRERRNLLRIIAVAEEMQTALHDYSDADSAIKAWQTLLKEFVSPDDAAGIRWKICWLNWKKGDGEAAMRAAAELLKENPGSPQASEARMLMARLDINSNKLNQARNDLMKYMLESSDEANQAQGLAWMAVVDFREHRTDAAFGNISKAISLAPGLVSSDVTLFSTYIQLLFERRADAAFEHQTARFFELYIDRPEAALIRLLSADLLLRNGKIKQAGQAYEMLSEVAPETSIGRKAFLRKLMLQHAGSNDLETLKPVLSALKTIAVNNQISDIEDESMLDQARLWTRLSGQIDQAEEEALDLYTQVSVGTVPAYAAQARQEGYALFVRHVNATLEKMAWLESIVLWRRYAQLREPPEALSGDELKTQRDMLLGVATAMRKLMDFDAAEDMLTGLYKDTRSSLEGDRVMLELAGLWLDRHAPQAYADIMRWLDAHPFTLYRPEMLLIAARVQLQQGQPSQASQTIRQVAEQDIAPEMRADYWLCKAEIAESLEQWHPAAAAWEKHIALSGKVPPATSLLRRADALFMADEFAEAQQIYMSIPDDARSTRWQFRMAVCEIKTGQWTQAEERLKALIDNPDASEYALRARLLLTDRDAVGLMEAY